MIKWMTCLGLLLAGQAYAANFNTTVFHTIYNQSDMQKVGDNQNRRIEQLATGVCSIGTASTGSGCCSGFRIGEDLVMTNFHCMRCIHKKGLGLGSPFSGNPIMHFIAITNRITVMHLKKMGLFDPVKHAHLVASAGPDPDAGRTNDLKVLNADKESFGNVNFSFLADGQGADGIYKIKKVLAANRKLDFAVIQLERAPSKKHHRFPLSGMTVFKDQELYSISHPGDSPFPDKKIYDDSDECRVAVEVPEKGVDFGHQCDTNPGSSGSPIISRYSHTVVGLHFAGGARKALARGKTESAASAKSRRESHNKAKSMSLILSHIMENYPELSRQLTFAY